MRKISAMTLAAMLVTPALAAPPARVAPSLYRVNGKPVPASCLEALAGQEEEARSAPIDLSHCGDPSLKPKTLPSGMVGYDDPQGGYFYYRYVGKADGLDILDMENSGGGSGQFSMLVSVRQDGRTVRLVRDIAGGDRCNTGISNATVTNGRLTFDQEVTPSDLIDMADIDVKIADDSLEGSAASCVGVRHMTGDDKHWTSVSLTQKDWADQRGWTEKILYQPCFNKLYRETVAAGHTNLDKKGLAAFGHSFVERCVRAKP